MSRDVEDRVKIHLDVFLFQLQASAREGGPSELIQHEIRASQLSIRSHVVAGQHRSASGRSHGECNQQENDRRAHTIAFMEYLLAPYGSWNFSPANDIHLVSRNAGGGKRLPEQVNSCTILEILCDN
jgi:hypothetical protein